MQAERHFHITLPASPESLPVVRQEIAAHAEKLGVAGDGLADLKTVVSEACTNVVRHAYGDQGHGTLEVDLSCEEKELSMVVRDFGGGIRPVSSDDDVPSLRLGLPIIGALSSSFQLVSVRSGGTEITIRFSYAETT